MSRLVARSAVIETAPPTPARSYQGAQPDPTLVDPSTASLQNPNQPRRDDVVEVASENPTQHLGITRGRFLRRTHPWAWWAWALLAAAAVSFTTNPLLVAVIVVPLISVMFARRTNTPWGNSFKLYLFLGLVILTIRIVFQIVMGNNNYGTILFRLPVLPLPDWMAGIRLGGPVSLEGIAQGAYNGLRLAALIWCVGVANTLANPKRALKAVPAALHEVSTALVIALSVAPQLVDSIRRVLRARRLRGGKGRGLRAITAIVVPVMEDSVERSMDLAAAMESRGYGATRGNDGGTGIAPARNDGKNSSSWLLLVGVCLIGFSVFGLLGLTWQKAGVASVIALGLGLIAVFTGLRAAGRKLGVTRYRPDAWGVPEWAILGSGVACLGLMAWMLITTPGVLIGLSGSFGPPPVSVPMVLIAAVLFIPLLVTNKPQEGDS
jgi:energy-coupling factor transport system permease protein